MVVHITQMIEIISIHKLLSCNPKLVVIVTIRKSRVEEYLHVRLSKKEQKRSHSETIK